MRDTNSSYLCIETNPPARVRVCIYSEEDEEEEGKFLLFGSWGKR